MDRVPRHRPIATDEVVLHNIHPNMVAVFYRADDADSLDVAEYYATQRNIPLSNIVGLSCDSQDNVLSLQEVQDQIEQPILSAIRGHGSAFSSSDHMSDIWVIVLCYNVPYRYVNADGEIMSIASRLHRMGFATSEKFPNATFDRKDWKFFDVGDAEVLKIVSHITAPTPLLAKILVDRSVEADTLPNITGKIFIDPYGNKETIPQLDYEDAIMEFVDFDMESFGLETTVTVDLEDPYIEPQVHTLAGDSFYWGWYTPRVSHNLFKESSAKRVFLYNADDDSGLDIHIDPDTEVSNGWCITAMNVEPGYAACAGATSAPEEDAYLRARPFFESLHRGASVGEAFLFSSPYVDWKIFMVGDPLMVVNFPEPYQHDILTNDEAIRRVKADIEEAYAWGLRQADLLYDIRQFYVLSDDLTESVLMLEPAANWYDAKNRDVQRLTFIPAASALLQHVRQSTEISFSEWIVSRNEKTTQDVLDLVTHISSSTISSDYIYPEGQWQAEWEFTRTRNRLENIHFMIEVSEDDDFSSIKVSVGTEDSVVGWEYEKELYSFTALPNSGLMSNYSGRRVRYTSPLEHYLIPKSVYYIRWTVISPDSQFTSEIEELIVTS